MKEKPMPKKFFIAMARIIDGIEHSKLDMRKVKRFKSAKEFMRSLKVKK